MEFRKPDRFVSLKIAPQPPPFKTNLGPVDQAGGAPGATLGRTEGRPAGRIDGPIGGGAARAVSQQSYNVQVQRFGLSLSGQLHRQVMGHHFRLLVGHAA